MNFKHILAITVTLGFCVSAATADDQEALKAKAKINHKEAVSTALASVPNGKIKSSEIENEGGKLIWSFDLTTPNTKNTTEVNVDAMTGKIVNTEIETPKKMKAEEAVDKAEAAKMKN